MISIPIDDEIRELVEKYSPQQDLGGFSNLNKKDLAKATRLDFQRTGLMGEAAWYKYHYNDLSRLRSLLDFKNQQYLKSGTGDNGHDDSITIKGITRSLDIKTTHVESVSKINGLNLVIPPRELHPQLVYVCAFAVGTNKDRSNVSEVVLAGFCLTEDIKERWRIDPVKWAVPVSKLKPVARLLKSEDKIVVDVAQSAHF